MFVYQKLLIENTRVQHLIAASFFVVFSLITIGEILFGESLFVYRDAIGPDPETFLQSATSAFELDSTRRLIYLGPFFAISSALSLSSLIVQKLTFLLIYFMIGFFAYISSYNILSKIQRPNSKMIIFFVSIIFGFFYMYNPRITEGLSVTGWGLAFSYSLIPLIFYYFNNALHEKSFSNIIVSSILITLAIAGTMQFLVWLPAFMLLPWLLIVSIRKLVLKQSPIMPIKNSLMMTGLFLLFSSYWVFPSIAINSLGITLQPEYVLTNQMLASFSSATSLLDIVRLSFSWWPLIELTPIVDESFWISLTFVVPVLVVLTILLSKKMVFRFHILAFALITLLIIFFTKGTQPPMGAFYSALYDVPIVGWMFRVPGSNGDFLPFFIGMIITFGFYELLSSQITKTLRFLKFLAPAVLLLSISLISWPMFTGDFGGIYKDDDKFVENALPEDSYHINVPSGNIAVFGDLNRFKFAQELFHTNRSSLIMTGHSLDILQQNEVTPDRIILDDKRDLLFYFLDEDSILIEPFTSTRNHDPSNVWSISGTNDPLHGPFHVYLEKFGIVNTDIDYNKGLVLTWSTDSLDIPLEVKGADDYHLFARYLESEAGGEMKVSLNGRTINIFTKSSENKFVWKDIGTFNLVNGRHTLILKNDDGLNAVNILVLIPSNTLTELNNKIESFINSSELVYVLDRDDLIIEGTFIGEETLFEERNESFNGIVNKQLITPAQTTHIVLQVSTDGSAGQSGYFTIKDLEILPIYQSQLFSADFENDVDVTKWKRHSDLFLSLIDEDEKPISGEHSLRIDIRNGTTDVWQVVSTEIPARGNMDIRYQFAISSENTRSPHTKIQYFDENNEWISDVIIFRSPSENYEQIVDKIYTTPPRTKYISLQFWTMPNIENSTSFMIDDIKVEQILPDQILRNNFEIFRNINTNNQQISIDANSLTSNLTAPDGLESIIRTHPIPVHEDLMLEYTANVLGENIGELDMKVLYYSQSDESDQSIIQENNQNALRIDPQSTAYTDLELPKTSNYTIAINAKVCEECQTLNVSIGSISKEFLMHSDTEEYRWLYLPASLEAGKVALRIHSEGVAYITTVLIHSHDNSERLDIFAVNEMPAIISDVKRASPTKYEVTVSAERPFMLTFDRPYDGLWSAFVNGKEYSSLMIYPGINGFYINEIGLLKVVIEYKPHTWFYQGSIITIGTIVGSIGYFIVQKYDKNNIIMHYATSIKMKVSHFRKLRSEEREMKGGH